MGALVNAAFRRGYVSGWRWGLVCGLTAGCALVGFAIQVGRWVGA